MEATEMSIHRWLDKEDVAYICNGVLLSLKKTPETLPFATTWMDLEGSMLIEIKSERQTLHTLTYI